MKLTTKQKIKFYETAKRNVEIRTLPYICPIMITLWRKYNSGSKDPQGILDIFPELLTQKPLHQNKTWLGWWADDDKASRLQALDNCINLLKQSMGVGTAVIRISIKL